MTGKPRAYVCWDKELALAYAKTYRTRKELKNYAHGCYAYLARHKLLDEAFGPDSVCLKNST